MQIYQSRMYVDYFLCILDSLKIYTYVTDNLYNIYDICIFASNDVIYILHIIILFIYYDYIFVLNF